MKAALSEPVEVKILARRPNGSGVVEIPLLPATDIDLAHTASEGGGKVAITPADLEEIAANFARFPGPVPIGVSPHMDYGDRGGFSPGFVNSVTVRAGVLFGQLDLIPALFSEIEDGGWRGFSVELAKNLKTATVELAGWVLTGGILTNRPATDTNFRIAASDAGTSDEQGTFSVCLVAGDHRENDMADDQGTKIAALEADLATEKETVKTLRANRESDKGDTVTLETRLSEAGKDLAAANLALSETKAKLGAKENEAERLSKDLGKETETRKAAEVKLEAEEARTLKEKVVALAQGAIDRGVSAKLFEGLDEDPVKWFRARYQSVESFEQFVDALPTIKDSAVSSGNQPDGNVDPVSKETAARLSRMGLNPKFAGVTNEDQVLALRAESNKE